VQVRKERRWHERRGHERRASKPLFTQRVACSRCLCPPTLSLLPDSYFEIYNEVVSDLLDPAKTKKALDVKEHPVLGVYVKGLQEIVVEDHVKMNKLIMQGMGNRHVASTKVSPRTKDPPSTRCQ